MLTKGLGFVVGVWVILFMMIMGGFKGMTENYYRRALGRWWFCLRRQGYILMRVKVNPWFVILHFEVIKEYET